MTPLCIQSAAGVREGTPGAGANLARVSDAASSAPEAPAIPADRPAAWEWLLLAAAALVAVAVRLAWVRFDLDDSFITYTYARSLAEGKGFVFAGQKALGTTTPLFALLMAGLYAVGLPMVETARALGLAASLAACGLLFALLRRALGPWPALAGAGLLAINVRHAAMAMSGMETALYTAVCLGALVAYQYRRSALTLALLGAACLLRPDGVLLAAVLGLGLAFRRDLRPAPLGLLAPVAAWAAYAWVEFGSPVPTSVTAKLAYPEYGAFRLEAAFDSLGADLRWPLAALAAAGLAFALARRRDLLPLAFWTLAYLLAFTRAPNFPWYYVPAIPGLIALALAGLHGLLTGTRSEDGRRLTVAAALGAAVVVGWTTATEAGEHRERIERIYGPGVTAAYHSLALWLRDNTPPDALVATPEVGYVGFYSERRVLDLAGLCSPAVIPYLPDRRYVEIVQDFRPDFVALCTEPNRPIHNTISESPWFRAHYAACKKFPYRGGAWYIVYRRIDDAG
jgi:arabinofuranosyltransferase